MGSSLQRIVRLLPCRRRGLFGGSPAAVSLERRKQTWNLTIRFFLTCRAGGSSAPSALPPAGLITEHLSVLPTQKSAPLGAGCSTQR